MASVGEVASEPGNAPSQEAKIRETLIADRTRRLAELYEQFLEEIGHRPHEVWEFDEWEAQRAPWARHGQQQVQRAKPLPPWLDEEEFEAWRSQPPTPGSQPRGRTAWEDTPVEQEGTSPTRGSGRRLNVNFSEEAYQALQFLARERGRPMADVLRDAIALEKWVVEELGRGHRILVERDGQLREIVLL